MIEHTADSAGVSDVGSSTTASPAPAPKATTRLSPDPETSGLLPDRVTVSASYKSWGGKPDVSSGTEVGITLTVMQSQIGVTELRLETMRWELWCAERATTAEFLKGTITKEQLQAELTATRARYAKAIEILGEKA